MGMKFLNKKGWHTGSLQNIERVWKAEQKDEAEKRKLDELKKQILEERERDEFRLLQEQAGFTPRQERLEFLYDSGLSVGKTSNEGFSALQSYPPAAQTANSASAQPSSSNSAALGALFEEKPQSANDTWRKLHSDPLLMIRQREQEALAQIKKNPVKMAMIRKSLEAKKTDDEDHDGKQKKKSKHKKHSSSKHQSGKDNDDDKVRKTKTNDKANENLDSDEDRERRYSHRDRERRHKDHGNEKRSRESGDSKHSALPPKHSSSKHQSGTEKDSDYDKVRKRKIDGKVNDSLDSDEDRERRHSHRDRVGCQNDRGSERWDRDRGQNDRGSETWDREKCQNNRGIERRNRGSPVKQKPNESSDSKHTALPPKPDSHRRRGRAPQLSEEERAARLREMQMDAELHEESRWKRLKKAEEDDAREASKATVSRGKSFLDDVHKSVYGAEKGGSSTIEESVRRRSHFLQRTGGNEHNAFRR